MTFTVFGTKPQDAIFNPQTPFAVRNDCQTGHWKVGDRDYRSDTLELSIIKTSRFFGSLGKTKATNWMQIWFVPSPHEPNLPKNTVCLTYIKTRSISQLSQTITELMDVGEPALGLFTASFEKHNGELGTYYSVQWDWRERETVEEQAQLDQIMAFMDSKPLLQDMAIADKLLCIDNLTPEEIQRLVESMYPQSLPQPQSLALART